MTVQHTEIDDASYWEGHKAGMRAALSILRTSSYTMRACFEAAWMQRRIDFPDAPLGSIAEAAMDDAYTAFVTKLTAKLDE